MADLPSSSEPDANTGDNTTGPPRWVYAFATVVIALVLLFVILHLAGGGLGGHTP